MRCMYHGGYLAWSVFSCLVMYDTSEALLTATRWVSAILAGRVNCLWFQAFSISYNLTLQKAKLPAMAAAWFAAVQKRCPQAAAAQQKSSVEQA